MSSHLGQCGPMAQCGLLGDVIHRTVRGSGFCGLSSGGSSSSSSSFGLGLAVCTGGHSIGFRDRWGFAGVKRSAIRSNRGGTTEARQEEEEEEVGVSTSGRSDENKAKKWMVAGLAAVTVAGAAASGHPALAFDWFGKPSVEKDPVEPFTIYGSILKKYLIEDVVDNKVVGRKKGFTASACVNALNASEETPELQGVPAGLKVSVIGEPSCAKGQGQTREESCTAPCRKACQGAVSRHLTEVKEETGYVLDQSDVKKVIDNCCSRCFNECTKPGKSISFVFPFRPH